MMNLFLKLVELRSRVEGFYKDTKSFGYKYVSGQQVLDKINPIMNELKLLFLPKSAIHRGWEKHEYTNKKNEDLLDFIVEGSLDYVWINAENPEEKWEINWQYYGAQNDISKAFGSALTYSERYLLLKSLGLPTDEEDPDGQDTSGRTVKRNHSQPTEKRETTEQTKSDPIADLVKDKNKEYYKYLLNNLLINMQASDLDKETKVTLAKRIINDHITKTLKLNFGRIELVKDNNEKPISKLIKVNIAEMIEPCNTAIKAELAMTIDDSEAI